MLVNPQDMLTYIFSVYILVSMYVIGLNFFYEMGNAIPHIIV